MSCSDSDDTIVNNILEIYSNFDPLQRRNFLTELDRISADLQQAPPLDHERAEDSTEEAIFEMDDVLQPLLPEKVKSI